jgi:hypothetical protein
MHIPLYNRFIAGNCRNHLLQNIKKITSLNFRPIIDYAGENCKSKDVRTEIKWMAENITQPTFIALKLSGLDLHNETAVKKYFNEFNEYHRKYGHRFLIDAEDNNITPQINNISEWASLKFNKEYPVFYKTYQMYRRDEFERLIFDYHNYSRAKIPLGIKLVRGAYYATEKDDGHLFSEKLQTDNIYNYALSNLSYFAVINLRINLLVASHNEKSLDILRENVRKYELMELLKVNNWQKEFPQIAAAQLYGMSDKKGQELITAGVPIYKYMPYGEIYKCLPYFTRRLYENFDIIKYVMK